MTNRKHTGEAGYPLGIRAEPLILHITCNGKEISLCHLGGAAVLFSFDKPVTLRYQVAATVAVTDTAFLLSVCHANILHFVSAGP